VGRIFALIVAVGLLVAAGLFYFSPTIAFYDIRSACKSNDIEALAKLIDFDSVRTSLKSQLDAGPGGVGAPAKNALTDPVGATGDALKDIGNSIGNAVNNLVHPDTPKPSSIVPPDPNAFLTPQALLALTYGYGKDAPKMTADDLSGKPPLAKIDFFSLDRTRLTVTDADRGTTTFTFERRGIWTWVLVHIGLPTPGNAGSTSSSASSSNPAG
jgi:hypothetical protein